MTCPYIDETTEHRLFDRIKAQLDWRHFEPRNVQELKSYCYYGYSNFYLRPKYWKLFLNYLPENKFVTEQYLRERRTSYRVYLSGVTHSCNVIDNDMNRISIMHNDRNFLDMEAVFSKSIVPLNINDSVKCSSGIHSSLANLDINNNLEEFTHRDAIKRILLTFKSVNSSIGYVQGMNVLLTPIYFVFATSDDPEDVKYAEADAFFCFLNLMCEIGDIFDPGLDFSEQFGIKKNLESVFEILQLYDPLFYNNLKDKRILDTPFHLRWVTLLFSHELSMENTILLWDKFLSDVNRFEIVKYFAVAVILQNKKVLEQSAHDEAMETLQNIKIDDVKNVFYIADTIRRDLISKYNIN